jgi:hypothetical protein
MSNTNALAVSVGVLAVLATWLFFLHPLADNHLQVWQAFIAWGAYFHCGGKFAGGKTTVACMTFGALVGMAAIMLAGQLGALGAFAAPVAVGLGAALIVSASRIPLLAAIPTSVYGFAAIAGLVLLSANSQQPVTAPAAILPTVLSVIIGAVFGYLSETLAEVLTKKPVAAAAASAA